MAQHAHSRVILVVLLILLSFPAIVFTQNSASKSKSPANPSPTIHRNAPDAELEAISKAEQEGRLLDAENLLTTALRKAESSSAPRWRISVLLNSFARVEFNLGHYSQAISAKQKELVVDKALHHPESTKVLLDLYALALFSRKAGDQAAADQAIAEELALSRKFPGPHQVTLVTALWEAAKDDRQTNRDAEAQALTAEAAQICQAPGAFKTNICPVILNSYYRETGETGQVEKILSEQAAQGPVDYHGHPDYGRHLSALDQLAVHYQQEGSYNQAEATYRKAIAVAEKYIPNPLVAPGVYYQYGRLLELEGKDREAEAAYKHAFDTFEHMQGRFRFVAIERLSETPLVRLYQKDGRISEAQTILEQALTDQEQVLDPHDEHLARTLVQLADLKMREGEYSEAEPLCERALKIQEADFGPDNPKLMQTLNVYAAVELHLLKMEKANALSAQAAAIRQKLSGRQ